MFKKIAKNLTETENIAKSIANAVKNNGCLICLYGDIGAGKTALTKLIAKHLEIKEKVTSPSFVILNEYHSGLIDLYHFDLYRLEEEGVASILDEIREYTESKDALALVEWAEFSSDELPDDRIEITIKYIDETEREFEFNAFGDYCKKILEEIK